MTTPTVHTPIPTVTKTYPDAAALETAVRHLRFLTDACATAASPAWLRLPTAQPRGDRDLVMQRLDGAPVSVADLPLASTALGHLHAAAYQAWLHRADLDQPFPVADWAVPGFSHRPGAVFADLPLAVRHGPVAIYKDSNIRNLLIHPHPDSDTRATTPPPDPADVPGSMTVAVVDFDDLTLAPFGYDLGKLLVSAAMTYGRISPALFDESLDAYNDVLHESIPRVPARERPCCTRGMLAAFLQIHHHLTAAYLGRNGYRHPWPQVRSWPAP